MFDDGNTASPAGNHNLAGLCQSADGFQLHDFNGLRGGNDPAESFAGGLLHIITLFCFDLRIVSRHIAADELGGLIKGLVIRIHSYLSQDGGHSLANTPGKELRFQGILNIITHIALAHGAAHAHGSGGIVGINAAQLRHGLVYHTDLRAVAVGDGELAAGFHQICQGSGSYFDSALLLRGGVA